MVIRKIKMVIIDKRVMVMFISKYKDKNVQVIQRDKNKELLILEGGGIN